MRNLVLSSRRSCLLTVTVALGLCLVAHGDDFSSQDSAPVSNDGPVYAFISVADTFELPHIQEIDQKLRRNAADLGSKLILLKVGTFLAGPTIETSRFLSDGPVFFDPLLVPPEPDTRDEPADFQGNHVTIVGSFKTLEPDSTVHLMTPYPQPISAAVQQAYHNAAPLFENGELSPFPSTVEVALFIFDNQGTAGASINDILLEIFWIDLDAPVELEAPGPTTITAEGILFPHTPNNGQFGFDLDLDVENGVLDADVCMNIVIDVKPGANNNTINVDSDNGVLPVAALTTADFDAVLELDPNTVVAVLIGTDGEVIHEVPALRYEVVDVDGDGDDDITFKFSVPALVDGPNAPLKSTSTILKFRGDTHDGMCVQSSDIVKVVPKK